MDNNHRCSPLLCDEMKDQCEKNIVLVRGDFLIKLILACPAIFVPTNFILYYLLNSNDYYEVEGVRQIPTISLTGADDPANIVFAYGLHLESIFLTAFFLMFFFEMRERLESRASQQRTGIQEAGSWFDQIICKFCWGRKLDISIAVWWNWICLLIGLSAALCMSIVGSVGLNVNEDIHSFFAFCMFLGGILHMWISYFRIFKCLELPVESFMVSLSLFIAVPFNLLLLLIAGITYLGCSSSFCISVAIDLLPIIEFTTAGAVLLYIHGLQDLLKEMSFRLVRRN